MFDGRDATSDEVTESRMVCWETSLYSIAAGGAGRRSVALPSRETACEERAGTTALDGSAYPILAVELEDCSIAAASRVAL